MKLSVQHHFPCAPAAFWEMYWDDEFDEVLRRESKVTRELLEHREEGDLIYRRLRFIPDRDLPRPVAKLIGAEKLIYEQENRWSKSEGRVHWKVLPSVLPGKLNAEGQMWVREAPGGCERTVEGDIRVKVPIVGGRLEKAVVEEISRSYDRTSAACRTWLATRKPA